MMAGMEPSKPTDDPWANLPEYDPSDPWAHLPEFGELDGKPVRLRDIPSMTPEDRANVYVTMRDGSRIRPYRFVGFGLDG